jgi:hypothetical protein
LKSVSNGGAKYENAPSLEGALMLWVK